MKYICENWNKCQNKDSKCIPVQEIKYDCKLYGVGYTTDCPYGMKYINSDVIYNVGSAHCGYEVDNDVCPIDEGFIEKVEPEIMINVIGSTKKVPLSQVSIWAPIFAKRDNKFKGMLIKADKGWIVKIGNVSGACGYSETREENIEICSSFSYTFWVEE